MIIFLVPLFLFFASYISLVVAIYKVKWQKNVVLRIVGIVTAIGVLFIIRKGYNSNSEHFLGIKINKIKKYFNDKKYNPFFIYGIFIAIWGLFIGITILILNSFLSVEFQDQDYYGRIVEFAFLNMPLLSLGVLYIIEKIININNRELAPGAAVGLDPTRQSAAAVLGPGGV